MTGPLAGVTVLEVAMYGFVPSAGAVLADWGANVIKVEHAVTGDPHRGLRRIGKFAVEGDPNPNIEHANRGKRSIGVDMSVAGGREATRPGLRRHHLRHRSRRRYRGGAVPAGMYGEALGRRRIATGERSVVAGAHHRTVGVSG